MKSTTILALLFGCVALAAATTYFSDDFSDAASFEKWVHSNAHQSEGSAGHFKREHGKYYNDAKKDTGLRTTEDYRFYTASRDFEVPSFSNEGKDLVLQFSVKHEQNIDCGGGYIKLLPDTTDQATFNGDSPYFIMFGPDICGSGTRKVHVIFSHGGKNHLVKKNIPAETDDATHLYTLIVRPDNTYEVRIDNKEVAEGSLEEDFDILPPKQILDPNAHKPSDWVDEAEIDDPTDKKPEGWDDIPREIADPDAKKPDDWDDELDGEWESPLIANPDYKGPWTPKRIPNPAYKGAWEHPKIDNPDFHADPTLYVYKDIGAVGFEIWQVKSGTIFDHILVTDSVEEAEAAWTAVEATREGEKKMKEAEQEIQRKKDEEERKAREAEEAAKKANEEDEDDDDEEDNKDEL